ncbi:MAG TPA: hypothetical protein VKE92_11065 [Anaerolineales bacterium]|nr:hypothetical protein [Anaerolineales bacterium]
MNITTFGKNGKPRCMTATVKEIEVLHDETRLHCQLRDARVSDPRVIVTLTANEIIKFAFNHGLG